MRLAICGHSRHGKETVSRYIAAKTGLRYKQSTSEAIAAVVFEKIVTSAAYSSAHECWQNRHNHRAEWARIIWEYNQPDGITLYRDMLVENDIFDGIRKTSELHAVIEAGIAHLAIWVDASQRVEPEGADSCQVSVDDCLIVIDNNGTLEHLYSQLDALCSNLLWVSNIQF